ncbi:hypothetical protein EMCG_00668 [[Emmonsia] crescens]|uniref:Uncharacterized protein n=1 Tax=[Emmonsia] crescens TaxID=73230 RepID=A0A0G2HS37_9EURO|nr:hypothetical protein EMCG_00668 [Emmonsia crescens UAMH 3008]
MAGIFRQHCYKSNQRRLPIKYSGDDGGAIYGTQMIPFSKELLPRPVTSASHSLLRVGEQKKWLSNSFTPLSGDTYRLGRVVLQAGFLGRNWFNEVSWLGLAPGPGLRGPGLGEQLQDIPDRATTIEYFDPNGQFAHSWSDHWEPLGKIEAKNETTVGKENNRPSPVPDNGLSNITKIGIGVGCGTGAILIVEAL